MKRTVLLALTSSIIAACSDNVEFKAGDDFSKQSAQVSHSSNFDKQALLADLTDHVFVPATEAFIRISETQFEAIGSYCADLVETGTENSTLKQNAQQAWRDNMYQWQHLEVMQIGPLSINEAALRNKIYSWPNPVNSCAVDQDVAHHENGEIAGSTYDIQTRTNSRRGIDALEYLLFNQSIDHSCPNDTLAPAGWNERPEYERLVARCEFAVTVAHDIHNSAQELNAEWTTGTNGNEGFASRLKSVSTNPERSGFDSLDDALNHITDALFYVDKITKDAKVGAPIGLISNSCGTAQCIDDIESLHSGHSLANIKANLSAMLLIFEGAVPASQLGFDDYLIALEAESLANTMKSDITSVITLIDAFETSLESSARDNPAQLQELYQSIKKVTDNLKSTFITLLALQLPASSAGDAD